MIVARTTLDQLFDPIFTREVSQRVIEFRPTEDQQSRLEELRALANEGKLTDEERDEYERFIDALDFLILLKARARAALDRNVR